MSSTHAETVETASPTFPLPPPRKAAGTWYATRPTVPGKLFERRVPPRYATLVTVQVKPDGVCFLSHPDAPERRIQIYADGRSIMRFHARALKGAVPTEFYLEAHSGG